MKLRKQQLLRILIGLVAVVVAGMGTVVIRDALAMDIPAYALPEMDVYYNKGEASGERLHEKHVRADSYSWHFLFGTKTGGGVDLEVWREIEPAFLAAETPMELKFTFPPKNVQISMALDEGEFAAVDGPLVTPSVPGKYTYRVEGSWGKGQTVVFFFRVEVPYW